MKKLLRSLSVFLALCIALPSFSVPAKALAEDTLTETVLYSGTAAADTPWTLVASVYTTNANGTFDPSEITPGGYFRVDYSGTEGAVYLAFAEWTTQKWASVNPTESGKTDTGYYSLFSFEDCKTSYNSSDFSDVDAICTGSGSAAATITGIRWFGKPVTDDLNADAILYKGSSTASAINTNLTFLYTKHVGGDWDGAQINQGSYFYVEYTGAKDGIYLALSSASGATQWVAVYPDETGKTSTGRYYSVYKYANFSKAFGTNFARLDEILAYSAKNESVTLKRIAYFAGEGGPVDTSDGAWDRSLEGIAFIGDSIVQNALLRYGDWNKLLDRTDCANYGIGGQTTVECERRISDIANANYSKVVMLCGINDIGHGVTTDQTISNYKSMFEKIHTAHPDTKIYVISVLPTTTAFYKDNQYRITDLNSALKKLIADYSYVTYVDCYSKFVASDGYCNPVYVFDGLHPNEKGYGVIAEVLGSYLGGVSAKKSIAAFTATLSKSSYTYNGSEIAPSVTLKNGDKTLAGGTDYKVTYSDNQLPGTATVTITGSGSYRGSITKTFTIKLGVPALTVTAGTKKAEITWTKVTGASGYELSMSASKKGSYSVIKKAGKTTVGFTKTGLLKGKTYYFKIRAYLTVKGKNYYGAYSTIKSVKIK